MTTSAETKHNSKSLVIDPDAANELAEPSSLTPSIPNGGSASINVHQTQPEQHGKRPFSPLKEVTNISAPHQTAKSNSASSQHPSSGTNGSRIPHPPRTISTLDQVPTTLQLLNETIPKARRWSSFTQSPRRNSFPSSRKDGVEDIRGLRTSAKLAREKGISTPIFNQPGPSAKRRKRSMSGIPSGSDGYFTIKPNMSSATDIRTRSFPTPSAIPHVVRTPLRRGSHVTGGSPSMGPRLEHMRRESTRSNVVENLPTTLWDYLMLEMETSEIQGVEEYKKERLSNFLRIPESFEKVFSLTYLVLTIVNLVWVGCLS